MSCSSKYTQILVFFDNNRWLTKKSYGTPDGVMRLESSPSESSKYFTPWSQRWKGEFKPSSPWWPWKPPKQHNLMVLSSLLVTAGSGTTKKLKALKMLLLFRANHPQGTRGQYPRRWLYKMEPWFWDSTSLCREGPRDSRALAMPPRWQLQSVASVRQPIL